MNIQMDKEYTTAKGHKVVIYNIMDKDECYPVHGAWQDFDGQWEVEQWTTEGVARFFGLNLTEKPKPKNKEVGYINVYKGVKLGGCWSSGMWRSRCEADGAMASKGMKTSRNRIACVRVEIEYEEGQFDD